MKIIIPILLIAHQLNCQPSNLFSKWYGDGFSALFIYQDHACFYKPDFYTRCYDLDSITHNKLFLKKDDNVTGESQYSFSLEYSLKGDSLSIIRTSDHGSKSKIEVYYNTIKNPVNITQVVFRKSEGSFLDPLGELSINADGNVKCTCFNTSDKKLLIHYSKLNKKEIKIFTSSVKNLYFGTSPMNIDHSTVCDDINYHFTFIMSNQTQHTFIMEIQGIPLPFKELKSFLDHLIMNQPDFQCLKTKRN